MARILLQSHAPTSGLAHLGTAIAMGTELRDRGHEVCLAYGGALPELIDDAHLDWRGVAEVPAEREWTPREWYRSAAELEPAVDAHLDAFDAFSPDVVVACHGAAGRVAAEIAGLPLLHAFHYLHTTRFARTVSLRADRRRDLRHPRRALRVGRARLRRLLAGRAVPLGEAISELRRSRGLPAAGPDEILGCPDSLVAIATAPFLTPARDLPSHWRYVGPISWSPNLHEPELPRGEGPLAYVTQGSTGEARLLERSVDELVRAGYRIVATTADLLDPAALAARHSGVSAERLLDGAACMRLADLAVFHGGQGTLLEAIRAGTPVIALPTKSDQIGNVHRVEELGVGRGLYPPPRMPGAIARAAGRVLDPAVRSRCAELAACLRERWEGARNAADLVERLAAGEEPDRRESR